MSEQISPAQGAAEAPEYRVKAKTFIAPHTLLPGAIIRTWSEPGDHLEPLNGPAHEAMERWYNKEYQEKDKDGVPKTDSNGKPIMFKPNYSKRELARVAPAHERASVILVANPPTQTAADAQRISDQVMKAPMEPDLVPVGGQGASRAPIPTSLPPRPTSVASHPADLAPGNPDDDTAAASFSGDTAIVSKPPEPLPASRSAPPTAGGSSLPKL